MSGFDNSLDIDESHQGRYNYEDEFGWEHDGPPKGNNIRNTNFMHSQYSEAYGAYSGGYGRDGGYAPHRMRPYLLRGPPPSAPLGFGPIRMGLQRPMHKAARFLAQCEVAPEYIRILPRQLLDLIRPDYCGLCAQHFDTFSLAKIHYNCKNHYKAQKKFMAQSYRQGTNDVPIKARNLYCELCDVHITSQPHADSHYAGRSHRADQLIRREKKNPPKTPDAAEVKELMDAPEDKNIPPELICSICNTTVSCTEQMTLHLNGKRHLSKEKQYILNTMKGIINVKDADDGGVLINGNASGGVADHDQEDDGGDQTAAAAEDWGNGSEGGDDWDANN